MLYMVSYDLIGDKNYQPLWDELKRLKAKRILESQWTLRSSATAAEVFDSIKRYIDSNDRLLVCAVDPAQWKSVRLLVPVTDI